MAFNDENAAQVPVGSAYLEERNEFDERLEVDRRQQDIVKRLDAISNSASFHCEFLRKLTEKRIIAHKKDDGTVFEFARNSENTDKCENERETELDSEKDKSADDENENCETLHYFTNNEITEPLSLENSTEDVNTGAGLPEDAKKPAETILGVENSENSKSCSGKEIESQRNEFNVQFSFDHNLCTMLFHAVGQFDIARKLNDEVLLAMPDNFNALWNKVKLMVALAEESGDCIDELAEKTLTQLEEIVSRNEKQMLIAKAEIAAMHTDLVVTGDSLIRCIQLYEEALTVENSTNQRERVCLDTQLEKLVAYWKWDLVGTYSKLTNANKNLLAEYGFTHGEVLSRLKKLVLAVDTSEHIRSEMKAQTWVNLANTFEHYRQNCGLEKFRQEIYDGNLSLRDCLAKASAYDPDNSTILFRTARELRQRSTSERDLREAIRLMEIILHAENIEGLRDIICHHIGLTYRSLWILKEAPITDNTADDIYYSTRNTRAIHLLRRRVIKPPDHPLDFDLVPPPYKSPIKAAYWKILNPIAHNPENPYLLSARTFFEQASLLDEDEPELSKSLYLLEIARTYLSSRNAVRAREYLLRAQNQYDSDIDDVDCVGQAVYESLGLLEENEMFRKGFNDVDTEKIKSFYRESIRFSTVTRTKPLVAFHYLLRILYKQLDRCVERNLSELDQMIIQNEYFLLYMAIHEAEDTRDIVNFLATDDFRIALIWSLVKLFNRRNHLYDVAAVFTYLSILIMAKQFTTEVKRVNLTSTEKERILIQSAERVTLQRVEQPRYLPDQYRKLHSLCLDRPNAVDTSDCTAMEHELTDMEKQKLDIVMKMIQPGHSPGYIRSTQQCYRR